MNLKEIRTIKWVSFMFALISFGMSLLMLFRTTEVELRQQAINWFGFAVVFTLLPIIFPFIEEFTFGGSGIKMRGWRQAVDLLKNIQNYLFDEINAIDWDLFKSEMTKPGQIGVELLFSFLDGWRTQQTYQLVHSHPGEMRHKIREQIQKLEIIFRRIIDWRPDNDPSLHAYYSRLAYICKDRGEPENRENWIDAYKYINQAIALAPAEKGISFTIYKFNRLICAINLTNFRPLTSDEKRIMQADFLACLEDKSDMLTETNDLLAPG